MTKRCHTCERKFGLVRHSYRLKQFCRKKCEAAYFDERRKESQRSRYRDSDEANLPHMIQ